MITETHRRESHGVELKQAVREMEAVLKKYDLVGMAIAANQERGLIVLHLDTTWTVFKETEDQQSQVLAHPEDYPSAEIHEQFVGNSLGVIVGCMATLTELLGTLQGVLGKVISQARGEDIAATGKPEENFHKRRFDPN